MRPSFDLLSRVGWKNLRVFGLSRWSLSHVPGDTWQHCKCLVLGHRFTDTLGGKPWCQRCYLVGKTT